MLPDRRRAARIWVLVVMGSVLVSSCQDLATIGIRNGCGFEIEATGTSAQTFPNELPHRSIKPGEVREVADVDEQFERIGVIELAMRVGINAREPIDEFPREIGPLKGGRLFYH